MSRKPRIHFPGAFYHVIARGNRLQKIFLEHEDYELYLRFLRDYKDRFQFFLYAYILMPNHLHFLIEVNESPLSRLMQSLQFRYSRNFNIKYRKWGHLFQGRYKAILCQKDSYFQELSAYIHLNAVRAGLVKDPREYPWSSYQYYVNDFKKDGLVDTDFLLAQFSDTKSSAREAYTSFVMNRLYQGHREDFYQLKDQCLLGSEEFVEDIRRSFNHQPGFVYDVSLPEIVSKTSSVLNIPAELFYTPTRNREGARGRSAAGYLARKLGGFQVKTVADHFNRDPVVISQGIKRLEQRLREEKTVARAMGKLEEVLTLDRKKLLI
jgi:REP element-mobilizing transposase RayT